MLHDRYRLLAVFLVALLATAAVATGTTPPPSIPSDDRPIQPPVVLFPNGGELFLTANTLRVVWAGGSYGAWTVELSRDGGIDWTTLASSLPADTREFSWTPENDDATTGGRIRLSQQNNPQVDASNANFTIDLVANHAPYGLLCTPGYDHRLFTWTNRSTAAIGCEVQFCTGTDCSPWPIMGCVPAPGNSFTLESCDPPVPTTCPPWLGDVVVEKAAAGSDRGDPPPSDDNYLHYRIAAVVPTGGLPQYAQLGYAFSGAPLIYVCQTPPPPPYCQIWFQSAPPVVFRGTTVVVHMNVDRGDVPCDPITLVLKRNGQVVAELGAAYAPENPGDPYPAWFEWYVTQPVGSGYSLWARIEGWPDLFHTGTFEIDQQGGGKPPLPIEPDGDGNSDKTSSPPTRLALAPQNPMHGSGRIEYALPVAGPVHLTVHDLKGRHVATLLDADATAGYHTLDWYGRDDAGRDLPAGIYFLRLQSGREMRTSKVTILH